MKCETSGAALSNEQRKLAVGNRLQNFHELQVDAFSGSVFVFHRVHLKLLNVCLSQNRLGLIIPPQH